MKTGNFDWFCIPSFSITQHVIQKQGQQEEPHQIIQINDEEDDDSGEIIIERQWDVEDDD